MQRVRPRQRQQAQKQAVNTEQAQSTALITAQESLSTVKTLVETSIGCLMYLRGFFSDQNFRDELVQGTADTSGSGSRHGMRNDAPMKVKQLKKGVTAESDLIIKLWEEGISEALEKQFLSSLILGIYLDENDDNDIVEAYTFNFSYGEVEGMDGKIPLLNLSESTQSVNIYDQAERGQNEGGNSRTAVSTNKARSVVDVRRQVQLLIRALITMSQTFQDLPRKRFLTMRLKYTDDVPLDYEPPGFVGGEPQERLLFATPSISDRPDQMSIGAIDTGFHGVNIHLATLAPYLRRAPDEKGLTHFDLLRADAEMQAQDASERKVLWNAEESADMHKDNVIDADALGEPDLSLTAEERRKRDEQKELNKRLGLESSTVNEPVGVRLSDGKVAPIPPAAVREAEDRHEKRLRGEPVSDDEDVAQPITFVVKHIRKEAQEILTPQTTNAIIAESIVSPPGTGPVTATGTSHFTGNSNAHARASQPEATENAGNSDREGADAPWSFQTGMRGPPDTSSVAAPSSPLAKRAQSVWELGGQDAAGAASVGGIEPDDVPMDLDGGQMPSLGLNEGMDNDFDTQATERESYGGGEDVDQFTTQSAAAGESSAQRGGNESLADSSMVLDPDETRIAPASQAVDSIKSFPQTQKEAESNEHDSIEDSQASGVQTRARTLGPVTETCAEESQRLLRSRNGRSEKDAVQLPISDMADMQIDAASSSKAKATKDAMGCACDDPEDGGLTMQCDHCRRWVHAHCYGYRSVTSKALPATFACYSCRLTAADVLTEDEKTKILAELGTLALTRHALDVLHTDGWPGDMTSFAKAIGASLANARNILNQCETEGFIRRGADDAAATAGAGTSLNSRSKTKAMTKAKTLAGKAVIVYKGTGPKGKLKKRYFTPGGGLEREILAPWLKQVPGNVHESKTNASDETSDNSQPSSQDDSTAKAAGLNKDVLLDKSNTTANSSSQTMVAAMTSTPVRPSSSKVAGKELLADDVTSAGARSSPLPRHGDKSSVTRSASKRKASDSENHEDEQEVEMARKRRAKVSRPGARIQLGDF